MSNGLTNPTRTNNIEKVKALDAVRRALTEMAVAGGYLHLTGVALELRSAVYDSRTKLEQIENSLVVSLQDIHPDEMKIVASDARKGTVGGKSI